MQTISSCLVIPLIPTSLLFFTPTYLHLLLTFFFTFFQMYFVPKSSAKDEKISPNTQTRKVVTLPCFYRSTCFFIHLSFLYLSIVTRLVSLTMQFFLSINLSFLLCIFLANNFLSIVTFYSRAM